MREGEIERETEKARTKQERGINTSISVQCIRLYNVS